MNAIKRKTEIYNLILKDGEVAVGELAKHFACSNQTIRRDLKELEEQKLISVGYGSASLSGRADAELNFSYKETQQLQYKENICRKAAELVKDGMAVAIDTGTTTSPLIKYIANKKITIITNNIPLLNGITVHSKAEVIVIGGSYDYISAGTMGGSAINSFKNFNADLAFITAMGISEQGELSVVKEEDAAMKRALFNCAKKRVLLVDQEKFGLSYLCKYQAVSDFDLVISNADLIPSFLAQWPVKYR